VRPVFGCGLELCGGCLLNLALGYLLGGGHVKYARKFSIYVNPRGGAAVEAALWMVGLVGLSSQWKVVALALNPRAQ